MQTENAPSPETQPPVPVSVPETPPALQLVTAAELVAETPPAPVPAPDPQPEVPAAAPLVRHNRTLADYAALDWSKTTKQLAEQMGVSTERIKQVRKALKDRKLREAALSAKKAAPAAPPPPAELFSDLAPNQQPPAAPTLGGPGSPPHVVPPINPDANPLASPAPADDKKFRLSAEATFDIAAGALVMAVGPEWAPRVVEVNGIKMDERENLIQAIERYYRAKGMPDLPPGVALGAAVAFYSMARFQQPNTREKFSVIWIKVKGFGARIVGFFRRRKGLEVVK